MLSHNTAPILYQSELAEKIRIEVITTELSKSKPFFHPLETRRFRRDTLFYRFFDCRQHPLDNFSNFEGKPRFLGVFWVISPVSRPKKRLALFSRPGFFGKFLPLDQLENSRCRSTRFVQDSIMPLSKPSASRPRRFF
jgi:hypothetical protein